MHARPIVFRTNEQALDIRHNNIISISSGLFHSIVSVNLKQKVFSIPYKNTQQQAQQIIVILTSPPNRFRDQLLKSIRAIYYYFIICFSPFIITIDSPMECPTFFNVFWVAHRCVEKYYNSTDCHCAEKYHKTIK